MLARHKRKLIALAIALLLPLALHVVVLFATRIEPPAFELPRDPGTSSAATREGVREVHLAGTPEQIGQAQARLTREGMIDDERPLWDSFQKFVPTAAARALVMDLSRLRYRHVDEGIPEPRRRELAAQARAFEPDPYADKMPTYHRMVFLHALYDIALSYEHSPLIGCSTFALGSGATKDGHVLVARAFDFEVGDTFDRDKVVFFVEGEGTIPFASVAWPGLVGVISGMNLEGVVVVVHGGRAREPRATGVPVVFSLREVLERAHDTDEAIDVLRRQEVMVSHIVFVADAHGRFAVVERAPGEPAFVRPDDGRAWKDAMRVGVTNHFEGPMKDDPKNLVVMRDTTSLARRARLDEMLAAIEDREADVPRAVAMLRDHECAGGVSCALGDRRAIDAFIATHGIVADATARVLWVSAGPHLSGKFVPFDLRAAFGKDSDVRSTSVPEDPILKERR